MRTFGIRVCLLEPAYTRTSFEQNMVLPDRTLDAYASARARANALVQDVMKTADNPDVVAEKLIEAVTASLPRRRYTCGKVARQVSTLRRFVPERMFDKSLRKQMGCRWSSPGVSPACRYDRRRCREKLHCNIACMI